MLTAGQKMTKNRNAIKQIVEFSRKLISSLLFPLRCPICDEILSPEETEKGIHLACENKLFSVVGAVCMHCGRPLGQTHANAVQFHSNQQSLSNANNHSNLLQFNNDIFEPTSTHEYCYECHRKGYVPATQIHHTNSQSHHPNSQPHHHNLHTSHITQSKSLYLYKGAIKTSMYRLKYSNKREYARYYAAKAIEKHGDWINRNNIQAIVPVPVYPAKRKRRGYNQAEVFAKELSKLTGIKVEKDLVRRVKDTSPQKELNYQQRKNNLENAFQKGKSSVQYTHILVVDDIYTTGCTAEAVAEELRKQGVRQIYMLSICIGGND